MASPWPGLLPYSFRVGPFGGGEYPRLRLGIAGEWPFGKHTVEVDEDQLVRAPAALATARLAEL